MPRKKGTRMKKRLSSSMVNFLLTGIDDTDDFDVFQIKIRTDEIKKLFLENKEELLNQLEGQGKCFTQKIFEESNHAA